MTTRDTRTCSTLEDFSMKQWKFQGNNRKYQTDVACIRLNFSIRLNLTKVPLYKIIK